MRYLKTTLVYGIAMICISQAHAQFGGIGNRAANRIINRKIDQAIDKKVDEAIDGNNNQNNQNNQNNSSSNSNGNRKYNKGGEGLKSTPPDVKEHLLASEKAFKAGSYGDARFAIQQAMLGVELEIGQSILRSFPIALVDLSKGEKTKGKSTNGKADSLRADTTKDQLVSSGWGWQGLTMSREYQGNDDKQITMSIVNNAMWMQGINMFFNNMQATGGQTNMKRTSYKGLKAVIEYDDGSGYKLSVPLGQTSLVLIQGVNFKTEEDFMAVANQFNIADVKAKLGEN